MGMPTSTISLPLAVLTSELSLPVQVAWLIPLYGFAGMLVSLPWASGWFRRQAHRPAAYLNILLNLAAFAHGSLILQEVFQSGPVDLVFPWLNVADLELNISFSLSLTNLVALELITGLSLLSQVYSLGYMDKEWALARFFALLGFFRGGDEWCRAQRLPVPELFPAGDADALHLFIGGFLVCPTPGGDRRPGRLPHQARW